MIIHYGSDRHLLDIFIKVFIEEIFQDGNLLYIFYKIKTLYSYRLYNRSISRKKTKNKKLIFINYNKMNCLLHEAYLKKKGSGLHYWF